MLTMFGIAWGIISITVMVAAGEGLGEGIQANQETFGKDVMIVFSGRTSMQAGGTRSGRAVHWAKMTTFRWRRSRQHANTSCRNWETMHRYTACTTPAAFRPWVHAGIHRNSQHRSGARADFTTHEDNDEARNVAFLGSDTKKQLFSEHEARGPEVWMNGIPYTVIGVMKSKEQNSSYDGMDTRKIFIPYNTMRRDFPNKPPAVEHTDRPPAGGAKIAGDASGLCAAGSAFAGAAAQFRSAR